MKVRLTLLWLAVGIPLAWGILRTLENAMKLFR
ncbi:MAG: oxalate:formate antiporter [Pseudomonadota bacterium]|nr:oxalate:formate antiporter [Pseudomonadota bacterium]